MLLIALVGFAPGQYFVAKSVTSNVMKRTSEVNTFVDN
jgi:hypothetical protein